MSAKTGRKPDLEKRAWAMRYGIDSSKGAAKHWRNGLLVQLCQCKTDEARRLILGKKEA